MTTVVRITKADLDSNNEYKASASLDVDGHIELEANLGCVKFKARLSATLSIVAEAGTGIKAGEGIKAGWGIEAGTCIEAGTGIKAGWGIKAGTCIEAGRGIEAGTGIKAGWGIKAGTCIEAGRGIEAGTCIEAGTGIKAGWGIKAGEGIAISTRIFAGVALWLKKGDWEVSAVITCKKFVGGEVAYGVLTETDAGAAVTTTAGKRSWPWTDTTPTPEGK